MTAHAHGEVFGDARAVWPAAARQKEIDEGNARLLNNLTAIAAGGASMDTGIRGDRPLNRGEAPAHAGPSMQATKQRQEQARIEAENQKLLQRITAVRALAARRFCTWRVPLRSRAVLCCAQTATRRSEFDAATLQKDFAAHEANLKRISRYPPPQ